MAGMLLAALALLEGCGASTVAAAPQLETPTPTEKAKVTTIANFGDSITCGYYALPADGTGYVYSLEGYAGLFDAAVGKPAQNLCRAGDQAADMARLWVYPNAMPVLGGAQLYTAMIGTNDANSCGGSDACVANWSRSLAASLAWLALPAADKVLGSAMTTRVGTWSADPDLAIGLETRDAGASLTFAVQQAVAGRSLNLAYRAVDTAAGPGGSAVVTVDGVVVTELHTNPDTGHAIRTQNGVTDTVFLARVPLGRAGAHTVTVATEAGGGFFSVLWAGVASQSYSTVSGAPRVIAGLVPQSSSSVLAGSISTYNAAEAALVSSLAADGMYITVAPTGGGLSGSDLADIVHPTNSGHVKLANDFLGVL